MRIITLLTDFGTADGYVAAMKGVIFSLAPHARLVDATHEIPAHDIRAGAWALRHYWRLFPEETIHVAVVDPGVGSARRRLLIRADGRFLIGPDNGLFSWVLAESNDPQAYEIRPEIRRREGVGATFEGRDVFAVAAGRLARGDALEELIVGKIEPIRFPWPPFRRLEGGIVGAVVHIDRFGNAITNIPASAIAGREGEITATCKGFEGRFVRCYSEVSAGEPLIQIDSTGLLELAVREDQAARRYGLAVGDEVFIKMANF